MISGQIVVVTAEGPGNGDPLRAAYFVAEPDQRKAIEIIRHSAAFAADETVEAVAPLTEKTLNVLKLQPGQFKSA
jgi:hypothetical protein